jgi:hypothetical protein
MNYKKQPPITWQRFQKKLAAAKPPIILSHITRAIRCSNELPKYFRQAGYIVRNDGKSQYVGPDEFTAKDWQAIRKAKQSIQSKVQPQPEQGGVLSDEELIHELKARGYVGTLEKVVTITRKVTI